LLPFNICKLFSQEHVVLVDSGFLPSPLRGIPMGCQNFLAFTVPKSEISYDYAKPRFRQQQTGREAYLKRCNGSMPNIAFYRYLQRFRFPIACIVRILLKPCPVLIESRFCLNHLAMLIVVSPAKTLDYESPLPSDNFTRPDHLKQSQLLINRLQDLSALDLAEMQHVSLKIAELNFERNHAWKTPFSLKNARQAIFAFKGDVYTGLDAYSLSEKELEFAQQHLRILSGLYGLLRPLDLMRPYRLEMGTKLGTTQGKNLYEFWDLQITNALNKQLKAIHSDLLINLASNEYFKSVKPEKLKARVITPSFKDYKNGEYKIISFFAKKARGLMTRFIIDNQITDPQQLKQFDVEGYSYNNAASDGDQWVFTRRQ
jgi:uncharacterized protein